MVNVVVHCRISGSKSKIVLPCNWVVVGFCGADGQSCKIEVTDSA
jgi:hypothetical protein